MKQTIINMANAATTPVRPEVLEAMLPYFTEKFGNPSSMYSISAENKKAITDAREFIAKSINTTPENIYFTAGGSESDNWALKAAVEAYASKGKHIITTKIEHHAILHSLKRLEKAGLVARRQDAQDVRRNQLELTAAGEAKVMAVREKMDALDAQMFLGVTDQEAMAFLKTCETMFDNLADESTRTLTICKLHRAARAALVANKEDD